MKGRTSSAGLCPQGLVAGQVIEVPRLEEKAPLAAAAKPHYLSSHLFEAQMFGSLWSWPQEGRRHDLLGP